MSGPRGSQGCGSPLYGKVRGLRGLQQVFHSRHSWGRLYNRRTAEFARSRRTRTRPSPAVAGFETPDFVLHISRLTFQGLEYLLSQTEAAEMLENVHTANFHGTLVDRAQGTASDWSFAFIGDEVNSAARGGRIAGPWRRQTPPR